MLPLPHRLRVIGWPQAAAHEHAQQAPAHLQLHLGDGVGLEPGGGNNGTPGLEDAERQIRDLRAKVGELTMERGVLAGSLGRFGLPSAKR